MTSVNSNSSRRVAILLENQFEDSEFKIPCTALKQTGATVVVLGARMNDEYQGKRGTITVRPDATATEVRAEDFDAIVIPGGAAPDQIRTNPNAVRLVKAAMEQGKLVAAVCHGPQVLIEADLLRGRQATGFRAIRKDMENAGAYYIDESVVTDGQLVTARRPGDLPMFAALILSELNLRIPDLTISDIRDRNFEWWQLGERWGGSSRGEIINMLNTAIMGERYTLETLKQAGDRTTDAAIQSLLNQIADTKHQNIALLEARLYDFGDRVTWQTTAVEAYATLQSWFQETRDDIEILRRVLGDIQTGVIDAYHLSSQVTDPSTADVLSTVEAHLAQHEQPLAELYRSRSGAAVQPPMPTTVAAS